MTGGADGAASAATDAERLALLRARLEGRVAWVGSVTPERGRRLRELLATVSWPTHPPETTMP